MITFFNSLMNGAGGNISSDFLPSSSSNAMLSTYLSHKLGMFISYGLTTFTASDSYVTNYLNDPPAPSTFAAPSVVDSAQWATEAANAGCDYAVLTTGHHIGFNVFPYTAPYNGGVSETTKDSNRGNLSVPVYNQYDVRSTPSSDQNIIGKFVDQCAIEGIKSCLYYNIGKNINIRRGLDLIDASYDQTGTYSQTYQNAVNFTINEIEWIINEYNPDYLWLDAPHHFPRYYNSNRNDRRYLQDVYNAIKAINTDTLVIINYDCAQTPDRNVVSNGTDNTRPPFTFDGTEMIKFPSDVISFEYFRVPTIAEFDPNTLHKGKNYYIPREVISTILTGGQYFARNDVFEPLQTLSYLQGQYNDARTKNAPYLLNVAVAKNGVIPANQITRFNEIVL